MGLSSSTAFYCYLLCCIIFSINCDVIVTRIRLSKVEQIRNITVSYTANEKPVVFWRIGSFISHFDNTTNIFNGSSGEASLRMYIDSRFEKDIVTWLYSDGYQVSLVFNKGDILNSDWEENNFRDIVLHAGNDGIIDYVEDEVVAMTVSLESEELPLFTVRRTWGELLSLDYQSIPTKPTYLWSIGWRQRSHFQRRNYFIMPRMNISGSDTVERITAHIDTHFPYTEGELEFGISLDVTNVKTLLASIVLRRFVYLRQEGHCSPFQNEVSFIRNALNYKRSDILSDAWPYVQFDAIGFPKPTLKMFRNCQEVTEPEVEVITFGTRFRTSSIFKFGNVTEESGGVYYISASNGDKQTSKMIYIVVL